MKSIINQTIFLAVIACLLWSSAFVGVKIGLQYHTPFQFAGFRFILSGLMLLLTVRNFPRFFHEIKQNFGFVFLIALLQIVVQYGLFYIGIDLVPASIGAMVIGASPLFVAIVAHCTIAQDKINRTKLISILLGIIGVAIISFRKKLPSGAEIAVWGILALILNNVMSGITNVIIAQKKHTISPLSLTSASLFLGGLGLFLVSVPLEGITDFKFPPAYYWSLLWLAFLSAAAVTIWNTLLRRPGVKVSNLNIWKFLIPVSGAILSWIILPNESPDIVSIVGMIVIAISLLILNFSAIRDYLKK